MIPANPASIEQATKFIVFTRRVGTPIARATPPRPPTAAVQFPYAVRSSTSHSATVRPTNHRTRYWIVVPGIVPPSAEITLLPPK